MNRTGALFVPILATLLSGCPWDNNDPGISGPTAADDSATVAEFSTVVIDLAGNDAQTGDNLDLASIEIVSAPTHGSLVVSADGTAAYTHDGTAAPGDSFSYTISDSAGKASSPATVTVTVTPFPTATYGLKTISSSGNSRDYYLDLPPDYDPHAPLKPLIIAYHGTGGSYERWLDYYRLREVVGDGAILVYPDARPNAAGVKQWNFESDFQMFEDLLDQLPPQVRFDPNRIFITGHSSGGGFAHELGCRYGNRIRAIAPDAGSLTTSTCVGSVGVLQIQGAKDSYVPAGIGEIAHRYWARYNGFLLNTSGPGVVPECIDHSLGASDYPVQWCLHQEGDGPTAHAWPSFANTAIWAFFQSLQPVAPRTDPPPGGGNERAAGGPDTTLSFTLRYPSGMGTPIQVAAVLRPGGTVPPVSVAPLAFLNLNFPPDASPGEEHSYVIPIRYQDSGLVEVGAITFPGTYTLNFVVYVEGGSFPIPAAGVDYTVYVDADLAARSTPVVIPGVLTLEPVTP
jgi:predicted esterase